MSCPVCSEHQCNCGMTKHGLGFVNSHARKSIEFEQKLAATEALLDLAIRALEECAKEHKITTLSQRVSREALAAIAEGRVRK